ncbi:MAG: sigma-70 family RNA polymerase sigma factor [Acidobacteriota bacterium]
MESRRPDGNALFEHHRPAIEKAIRIQGRRSRLSRDEAEELYSLVMIKVVQDDFRLLRSFRGDSSDGTFFAVVVRRALMDLRCERWGRWRPCARAKRLGSVAVVLDKRIHRDGLTPREAIEELRVRGVGSAAELEAIVEQLPRRTKRRFVPAEPNLEHLPSDGRADERIERELKRERAGRLRETLSAVLADLSDQDRRLLNLRFGLGWTVRRIAEALGVEARPLYRRFERLLRRLRRRLVGGGFDWGEVRGLLEGPWEVWGSDPMPPHAGAGGASGSVPAGFPTGVEPAEAGPRR